MKTLSLPLDVKNGRLLRTATPRQAVDQFLRLLLDTPQNGCIADRDFGFILNNLRFELFNEHEGVVYNSVTQEDDLSKDAGLYDKKISGSSRNLNTFAAELKLAVERYEQRLTDVAATMTYIREERTIYINVKGRLLPDLTNYSFTTTLKVWN